MKLRILNEFGVPLNLAGVSHIKVQFPHEAGKALEKNNAKVLDKDLGTIEVELSDFEIQGLKVGKEQNILGEVLVDNVVHHVLWSKGLDVEMEDGRKVIK